MSGVTIKFRENVLKEELLKPLLDVVQVISADVLSRSPEDIIVELVPWEIVSDSAPDILIRCETSPFRKDALNDWATKIVSKVSLLLKASGCPGGLRIACKAVVTDSCWVSACK